MTNHLIKWSALYGTTEYYHFIRLRVPACHQKLSQRDKYDCLLPLTASVIDHIDPSMNNPVAGSFFSSLGNTMKALYIAVYLLCFQMAPNPPALPHLLDLISLLSMQQPVNRAAVKLDNVKRCLLLLPCRPWRWTWLLRKHSPEARYHSSSSMCTIPPSPSTVTCYLETRHFWRYTWLVRHCLLLFWERCRFDDVLAISVVITCCRHGNQLHLPVIMTYSSPISCFQSTSNFKSFKKQSQCCKTETWTSWHHRNKKMRLRHCILTSFHQHHYTSALVMLFVN